jgi:hypothetical protein
VGARTGFWVGILSPAVEIIQCLLSVSEVDQFVGNAVIRKLADYQLGVIIVILHQ